MCSVFSRIRAYICNVRKNPNKQKCESTFQSVLQSVPFNLVIDRSPSSASLEDVLTSLLGLSPHAPAATATTYSSNGTASALATADALPRSSTGMHL